MPPILPPEAAPLETHWNRILYYDLFDADADARATRERERPVQPRKEPRMPSSDPFRDPPPIVERSPLAGALVLLGIYVVLYLSVAAALHVLEPANASTVESAGQAAVAETVSAPPAAARIALARSMPACGPAAAAARAPSCAAACATERACA